MCFNARYRIEVALKRAQKYSPDEVPYWETMLKKYDDWFQVSAFTHPTVLVYTNEAPYRPQPSKWGLIPPWAKNPAEIWNKTLNARAESIFEKPSFKASAKSKRCIVPAEGFYEYHHHKGKTYPYYIYAKSHKPFNFAGLWNEWTDPNTGEIIHSFSVVTTKANDLMKHIHNKPRLSGDHRMPVILNDGAEDEWLKPLSREELRGLLEPCSDSMLQAHTVKPLSGGGSPGNVKEANERFNYPELHEPKLF